MKPDITAHMLEQDPERCALTLLLIERRVDELRRLSFLEFTLLELVASVFGEEGPLEESARLIFAGALLAAALAWYQR
jgi:hypothetical protein